MDPWEHQRFEGRDLLGLPKLDFRRRRHFKEGNV
jgi:hypothetical protein